MNGVDIAVIVIVCVAVAAALGYLVYRKVKHRGGCCSDCSDCSECSGCTANRNGGAPSRSSEHCNGGASCQHCTPEDHIKDDNN